MTSVNYINNWKPTKYMLQLNKTSQLKFKMKIVKICFIVAFISFILVLATFNYNPIYTHGLTFPGLHVLYLLSLLMFSLLLGIVILICLKLKKTKK